MTPALFNAQLLCLLHLVQLNKQNSKVVHNCQRAGVLGAQSRPHDHKRLTIQGLCLALPAKPTEHVPHVYHTGKGLGA